MIELDRVNERFMEEPLCGPTARQKGERGEAVGLELWGRREGRSCGAGAMRGAKDMTLNDSCERESEAGLSMDQFVRRG